MNRTSIFLLPLGLMAGTAFAQVGDIAMPEIIDSDGNGTFSRAELEVIYPDLADGVFADLDADMSGELSEAEVMIGVETGVLIPLEADTNGNADDGASDNSSGG